MARSDDDFYIAIFSNDFEGHLDDSETGEDYFDAVLESVETARDSDDSDDWSPVDDPEGYLKWMKANKARLVALADRLIGDDE